MATRYWKEHEKRTSKAFGGRRVSSPWRKGPDSEGDWYVAECKARKLLPQWLVNAVMQAVRDAKDGQLPIAVLHQKHQRSENDLVVMRRRDFEAWFGNGQVPEVQD
ncbi:MAG: hypothetical protein PHZ19_12260 [Candidatus Thermoplasmatota archaeon]|jgi:hypothetical protein|nr:hypothetical protein [Candidatus Thermoplasmatota archaeon]